MKCAVTECARDAAKRYLGRSTPGRAPDGAGVSYCSAHYEQLRRGEELRPPRVRGPRGISPYRRGVEDAASIAEFHGHTELAELLRRLR